MIIDVNVSVSRWPFRRLPCDELPKLVDRLQRWNVGQAWVGSFDGLFHKDLGGVNARLTEDCRRHPGLLVPFGSVNPLLPDWQEDLRRCHEDFGMPGIRLHPNYHGYRLDDPALGDLLRLAQRRNLIVQLALSMEDSRTHHPLMQVGDVDVQLLPELAAAFPELRLVLLNSLRIVSSPLRRRLTQAGRVYFEIAMLEAVGGVARLLADVPLERVLFGSHLPFYQLESAVLKIRESGLPSAQEQAVTRGNAEQLLGSDSVSRT